MITFVFMTIRIDRQSLQELKLLLRGASLDQASFFGKVFHPEYNIHHSDAEDVVDRFESHGRVLEATGILSEVESDFGAVRGKMLGTINPTSNIYQSTNEERGL